MERNVFETEDFPKIITEKIMGSLKIKGWDRDSLRVDSETKDSAEIDQVENTFTINSKSDCILRVPLESEILIENVQGDLVVKSIDNHLTIENVEGQVVLKNVGTTTLENVDGNFSSKQIEGDLIIETANGNVMVRDVEGVVTLEDGKGNFNFAGFSQKLEVNTEGNATITLMPEFDDNYSVKAGGNIICHMDSTLKGTIKLVSQAEQIRLKTQDQNEIITETEYEICPDENEYELSLEADGKIDFLEFSRHDNNEKSFNFDRLFDLRFDEDNLNTLADDITQQVTDNISTSMDSITDQINIITSNIGKDKASVEEARKKLKNKKLELRHLAKAQREVAHKARRSALKSRKAIRHKRGIKHHSREIDPVSDIERQMILQMLQDKKIDINQAEVLLAALEGKEVNTQDDSIENPLENIEINIPELPELPEMPEISDPEKSETDVEDLE